MILCLDVGNSQIHGGVFHNDSLIFQFRKDTRTPASSDELGVFFINVLKDNNIKPNTITQISICSVVPEIVHSLRNCCLKYFNLNPFFLKPGVKTGLRIHYHNPVEVGSDRIANAIAGIDLFPNRNLIIIDFGTATTFCVISKNKEYLGGIIIPGISISMNALVKNASKLQSVEIIKMSKTVGRSTTESIQSGLYFGQIGIIKELKRRIIDESFDEQPVIIGTGGFSSLFEDINIFDTVIPDLVLQGLRKAFTMNTELKRD